MPCSDGAPPEWVGKMDESNREAARLLCFMCQHGEPADWPPQVLAWYLGHRRIDLARLEDARTFSTPQTREEAATIRREIVRIEEHLAAAGERFETTAMRAINTMLAKWQRDHGAKPGLLVLSAAVALHLKSHAPPDLITTNELTITAYRGVEVLVSPEVGMGRFLVCRDIAEFDRLQRERDSLKQDRAGGMIELPPER